ncbi:MAG: hypothetical protein SGARI_001298, partial [Bacillariaceae sp.]
MDRATSPAITQLFPATNGTGKRLGGTAVPIQAGMSAKQAAAMAAMSRIDKGAKKRKRLPMPIVSSSQVRPKKATDVIDLLDDSSDSECEMLDRKPAAKRRRDAANAGHDFQPGDEVFVKASDGRTEGPLKICRVHITGHVTVLEKDGTETKLNAKVVSPCFNECDDERADGNVKGQPPPRRLQKQKVIEIDDDDVIDLSKSEPSGNASVPVETVTIVIDSRERSQNTKPRELRIGLSETLATGSLHDVWHSKKTNAIVIEKTLSCGDFAFDLSNRSAT